MPLFSQGVSLAVPDPDNARNVTINDLIGNRSDTHEAATILGRLFDMWTELHTGQLIYPPLADPILVRAHNDPWVLGDFTEIIPANAITFGFHIHHVCICEASANGNYEIALYQGTTLISAWSYTRTDKKDDIEGIEINVPSLAANVQIQAKLASGNTGQDTAKLKLWYHPHG